MIVAATVAGAARTKSAASPVVMCSSTTLSPGKSRTMAESERSTNTRSRSNTSMSGSVTSPCTDSTTPCFSMAASAGYARASAVTPEPEFVVAPAG